MLLEFVAQCLYFRFPEVHFLCDVHNPSFETRSADALVWTMMPHLDSLALVRARGLGVLDFHGVGGVLHLARDTHDITNARNLQKNTTRVFFFNIFYVILALVEAQVTSS